MIIQHLARITFPDGDKCVHNTAKLLDWVTAVALLVIGVLGVFGVMPLAPALTYSFLGAGIVYTIVMLLSTSLDVKIACNKKN